MPSNGEWIGGRQYWDGTYSEVGQINKLSNQPGAGQRVSDAVIKQTNPNNLAFINNNNTPLNASNITSQSGVGSGVEGQLSAAQQQLQSYITSQQDRIKQQIQEAQKQQDTTLASIKEQSTPFQEDYQKQQQEKLYINQNFEENQKLTSQLGSLLSEGQALIKQQQQATGLASIRNPRISQTMSDVAAQAGVIQAVLSARNNQIAQAQQIINTNIGAIQNDRNAQISYYQTVLQLNNQKLVNLDQQSQQLAQEQIGMLKQKVASAQQTADYITQLLVNPATSQLMGQAGVSLNDSVEGINQKLANAQYNQEVIKLNNDISAQGAQAVVSPAGIPSAQLVTMTDSKGVNHYYKMPTKPAAAASVKDSFYSALKGISSGGTSSAAPTFKPAKGEGTIWVDASGIVWKYTNGKWVIS